MRIAITGSSGFLGTALGRALRDDGHEVVPVVRRPPQPGEIGWDPAAGRLEPSDLRGLDAVVHLAGENIGEKRLTDERKRQILDSRVGPTRLLADAIAATEDRPPVLLSASGIGYYGDRGDEVLVESSGAGDDFAAGLCVAWEAATEPAQRAGVRVACMRTAPVLHGSGGIFPRMALPFRLGFGGRLGSGRQWMSWISLADQIGAIRFLLEHDVRGPVNMAAPEPVTNAVLTKAMGAALHRPSFLVAPAFALRLALGRERADGLLLVSQRVVPDVLRDAGFEFRHPLLVGALEAAVAR